jgi:DNA adenine methylase
MNGIHGSKFVEPFCGGASVSIAFLENNIVESVVLNDADSLIASVWACIFNVEDAKWLSGQVETIPLTLEEWKKQKALQPSNYREAGLKGLYLNRTSFNGIIHKAGPIGGWDQKKRTLSVRFNRERLSQRILELSELSDSVEVFNESWRSVCSRMSKSKNPFFYLDPPYYYKAEQLYGQVFKKKEHEEFRDFLFQFEKPWLLSYDDTSEIRELYHAQGLQARVVDSTYSTHPLGGALYIGRELIYTNMNGLPKTEQTTEHIGLTLRKAATELTVKNQPPLRIPVFEYAELSPN